MKSKWLFLLACVSLGTASAQTFVWNRIAPDLPSSIKVFEGTATGPIYAWYAEIDYADTLLRAGAFVSTASGGTEAVSSFARKSGAYVAINGGFFGGGQSYSLVVSDGSLAAKQIAAVSRTAGTYPLMRANFGITKSRVLQTAWIYHFGDTLDGVFRFAAPLPHTQTSIAPAPQAQNGASWSNLLDAIGGGPNLVSKGQVNVTYDEEVMFGSGVGKDNGDPRTAIGYTAAGKIIMFVVDGRRNGIGLSLPGVASVMIQLGCVEALNLDGGGSSTFCVGGAVRNTPSDGSERAVASAFVIGPGMTNTVPVPTYERSIDTNDPMYDETGPGWFNSANPGYFGSQPARLNPTGTGEARATFRASVPKKASYDLFAWWVSASNRATNTPFIVYTKGRVDTVRVDQTVSGGNWYKIGTFTFGGAPVDSVVVTNQAVGKTSPAYVVVDGLKLVSFDRSLTNAAQPGNGIPDQYALFNNYPNPFNPTTTISFQLPAPSGVEGSAVSQVVLKVYDVLGREIATLCDEVRPAGTHVAQWDASGFSSGVYFYRLEAHSLSGDRAAMFIGTKKMLLVR
jgi:hypothetical protein